MKIALNIALAASMLIMPMPKTTTKSVPACTTFGFCEYNGKKYWFEDGIQQGVYGDSKNIKDTSYERVERGREIFDPDSGAWYWLDAIYDGAAAYGKEVWMPYIYQNEDGMDSAERTRLSKESDSGLAEYVKNCIDGKTGKWVRYDSQGKMMKGWVEITDANGLAKTFPNQKGNKYYYDKKTGMMVKGWRTINGKNYHFDEQTGVLQKDVELPEIPF